VYASRFADEFEDAAAFGWTLSDPSFDWAHLIANKDREIARLEAAYVSTLERNKVEIVRSRAVIEDPHTIQLADGKRVRADKILVATGGAPSMGANIAGLEHVISSNDAFHLKKLPPRILIQGGGYIAVEFACIFANLGSKVTLVYRRDNILRGFDDDLRAFLRTDMEKNGIKIITQQTVNAVEKVDHGYCVELTDNAEMVVDAVMFATGRHPNIKGIGLEAVGVKIADNGGIAVDEYSRTNVESIYAVGDVTNRINLTPVAIREGHAFADTVFGGKSIRVDHTNVPTAVFTSPELGTIGLTETQAVEKLGVVDIYKTSFRPMKYGMAGRDSRMFMKLVVDGTNGRVVGCHIAGPEAGEMIQLVGIAVKMGATKADFDATMAVHPTMAEEIVTLREKAMSYGRAAAE
jgi:glutathione reductase (NADPH)